MASLSNGWLVMQYPGPELATVHIKVGDELIDAYIDWQGKKRIAKIRPPATPLRQGMVVELWVNGGVLQLEKFNR